MKKKSRTLKLRKTTIRQLSNVALAALAAGEAGDPNVVLDPSYNVWTTASAAAGVQCA